jgi:hypothetical protein
MKEIVEPYWSQIHTELLAVRLLGVIGRRKYIYNPNNIQTLGKESELFRESKYANSLLVIGHYIQSSIPFVFICLAACFCIMEQGEVTPRC